MTFATLKIQITSDVEDGAGMPSEVKERKYIESVAAELSEKDGIHAVTIEEAPDPKFKNGARNN